MTDYIDHGPGRGVSKYRAAQGLNGLPCPKCKSLETAIIDSRRVGMTRRRRRGCNKCGARWTTVEITVPDAGFFSDMTGDLDEMVVRATILRDAVSDIAQAVSKPD